MEEYKNFVFYGSWEETLSALPLEQAKELLWQIKEIGIGREINTDDKLLCGIIKGTIMPNIKAAQRKYDIAVENGAKGGRPRLDIDMERVAELKAQGKTNEEIGRALGVSKTTIQTRWTEYREKPKTKNQERNETETEKEKKINLYKEKDIDIQNQKEADNFLTAHARQTAQLENNNAPSAQLSEVRYKAAPSKKKQIAFDFSDIMKQDEAKDENIFDISKNEEERRKEIARKLGL